MIMTVVTTALAQLSSLPVDQQSHLQYIYSLYVSCPRHRIG